MNCREWEEQIALEPENPEVERHLAGCTGCRDFANSLKDSLEILRTAHLEPLDPAHYTVVRSRVLAEIERERSPSYWPWIAALAAAIVLLLIWPKPPQRLDPPAVALAHPPAPGVAPMRPQPATAGRPRPAPLEPLVVKIVTDNPDVVIYWISNPKGEF